MSDAPYRRPAADSAYAPDAVPTSPAPTQTAAPPLTPAEQETVDTLYAELKPMALTTAREYVLARTPVPFQDAMKAKIDADFPPPAP